MRNNFKEKHKLPLTFQYIEMIKNKSSKKKNSNTVFYTKCTKYETDFYAIEKPIKPLVRML